ncbi:MAG: mechanosensitive ion channel domain-containing protein [Immundisolibacter sp.]|uniref:mechanosensitive ion channel domain-containing protein n=1 Tax=Immundisolibacter sp. TaxID=1934948 RepID=UPI003EE30511
MRALSLVLGLCGLALAADDDDVPDTALIEQQLSAVQADGALTEADRAAATAQLQAAQRAVQDAAAQHEKRDDTARRARLAPGRIAALRDARPQLLPLPARSAGVTVHRAALSDAQSALEAALGEFDRLARQVQALTQAPLTLQRELAQARTNLQNMDNRRQPDDTTGGLLARATSLAMAARRSALLAGIALREEQLRTVEVRRELAQAERDAAERRAVALQDQVAALSARLSETRQKLARQELVDAETLVQSTADAHPLIRQAAAQQAVLTRELAQVLQADDATDSAIVATRTRQSEIEELYRTAQAQLDLADLSGALVKALNDRRLRLPRPSDYSRNATARNRDIGEARLRQLQLTEQQRALGLPYQRAGEQLKKLQPPLDKDAQAELRRTLIGLLRAQADLLGRLDDAYARHIALLSDLDRREQQLLQVAGNYTDLLDRRLLWTADLAPMGLTWLRSWPAAIVQLLHPARWGELPSALVTTLATQPWWALSLALPLMLMALRGRLRRHQLQDTARLSDIYRDGAWLTLRALAYSGLRAVPWPLLLYLTGVLLELGSTANSHAGASGAALSGIAPLVFVLNFVHEIARDRGVLDAHYQWRDQARRMLRRQIVRLRLLAVPSGWLIIFTETLALPALRDTIGRASMVLFSLALAVFLSNTLHPQRGVISARHNGLIRQATTVAIPLLLAALAALGFYYAAIQLQDRLVQTAGWLLGVLLVYYLVLRALAITGRRLRLQRATTGSQAADGEGRTSTDEFDIEAVDEQARRLLGFALSLTIGGVLLWVWADLLPALQALDQVLLWDYQIGADSGEASDAVTLLSLVLAAGSAAITVLAASNLPGVLEIAVLRRTSLDAGARYATITVTRYIIVIVGVLTVMNLLGVEWAKAQWLVAALGVGIGFGLQEIIANFISGLIILGERPYRVGDLVTVGGVSGTVTRIRIRATTVTDFDRKELIVPNKTFITEQFINWTLSDQVLRVVVRVGVAYGSDTARTYQVLLDTVQANARVLHDPSPMVLFTGFGDSSLDFEVRAYVRTYHDVVPVGHELHMAIDQALRAAGIEIPFPQRDLHLRSVAPLAAQAMGSQPAAPAG